MKRAEKIIILITALIFFLLPLSWYPVGSQDLGGDSTRLYFYDPVNWLKNIALYLPNPLNSLGKPLPNFYMIPFLGLLVILKTLLFNNTYLLNALFSGLLLSGGFVSFYLFFNEFSFSENHPQRKIGSFFGSLLFILSPLIIFDWFKALYSINQVFIYPLILYFFIKYLKTEKIRFIFLSEIIVFVFSVNFSLATFPWFLSFFSFSFLLLIGFSIVKHKFIIFLKGFICFSLIFLLLEAFQLVPQLVDLFDKDSLTSEPVFSQDYNIEKGFAYFLTVQDYVRLTYNLIGQQQLNLPKGNGAFDFGLKYRHFYYIYILTVTFAGSTLWREKEKDEKKIFGVLLLIFILLVFLITSRITKYSFPVYKSFFNIPAFSMFRSFYVKFSFPFCFFYSLIFGYSLNYLLKFFKYPLIKIVILIPLMGLLLFNGWPFLSGMIVNSFLWQSRDIKAQIEVSDEFQNANAQVKQLGVSSRILELPLTGEEYQIWSGKKGGAYIGISSLSILAGKESLSGFGSFGVFQPQINKIFEDKNWFLFNKYLSLLNVRYAYYNNDEYIYDGFPSYPYSTVFKNTFPFQNEIEQFLKNDLGSSLIYKSGQYSLWQTKNNFLPLFYTPINIYEAQRGVEIISDILSLPDYKNRSAIYFDGDGVGEKEIAQVFGVVSNNKGDPVMLSKSISEENLPFIEFQKINPSKYLLRVHNAKGDIPLIFSNSYSKKWKLSVRKNTRIKNENSDINNIYETPGENLIDQATKEEIEEYISLGALSAFTAEGKSEGKKMNFISKLFNGTIENNNLKNSFGKTKNGGEIKDHIKINGYANLWFISVDKICNNNNCTREKNGNYEIQLVLEYWPQKLLIPLLTVSGVTLIILILLLIKWPKKYAKD